MNDQTTSIQCLIFRAQEQQIQHLTTQINQAKAVRDTATLAEELGNATQALLDCEEYQKHSLDCSDCQQFSELRRKAAQLILTATRHAL